MARKERRKPEKGTFALPVASMFHHWLAFLEIIIKKKKTNMKKTISDRYRAEQRKQGQFLCTTLARDLLPVSVAVQIIQHVIKHVHAWSAFSIIIGNNGHSFQGHLASEPQSFSVLRTEDAAGWRIGHAATLLLGIFF